jgi:RNA polymerase sigma-B factor
LTGDGVRARRGRGGRDLGELHETLARTGDAEVRAKLVLAYDGVARKLAARLSRRNHQYEDLIQVARMGLLKALDRFDPRRGVAFTTYGWQVAQGELKRHLRDHSWALHVPRGAKERYFEVRQSSEEMQHELGRSPTIPELAEELGLSDQAVVEAIEVSHLQRTTSIDGTTMDDDDDAGIELTTSEEGFDMAESVTVISSLVSRLPPRERDIIRLRFVDELTQAEIGERVGVSQMHVSRILAHSLARLRSWARTESQPPGP